ncbi:hypothetical protein OAU52_00520 [bacterium]|nr:hypothetical protein [bacterium]
MALIILGGAIVVFFLYLLTLFFQIQGMENRLDDALKNVEICLLKEFGEVSNGPEEDE